jgi:hypothetical protein
VRVAWLFAAACSSSTPETQPEALTPAQAVAELLSADRAFAAASARTDLVSGVTPMLASDVIMPAPGERIARGIDDVLGVLRSNPDNARSRVEWTPIRGGISADGRHGFTYGYMTTTRADGTRLPGKYLSYWVRHPEGWRVAAYKRLPRAEGPVSMTERQAALPARIVQASTDAVEHARLVEELKETERTFSRDAQVMGLGPAFVRYAAPDAMNAGGADDAEFLFGPEAIGQGVGSNVTPGATITWEPTDALVASSGDVGVTPGIITVVLPPSAAGGSETRRIPYFTVWRRSGPGVPWRFVAE